MTSIFYALEHISELIAPRWIGIFFGVPVLMMILFVGTIVSYFKTDYEDRTKIGVVLSGVALAISSFVLLMVLFFFGVSANSL